VTRDRWNAALLNVKQLLTTAALNNTRELLALWHPVLRHTHHNG